MRLTIYERVERAMVRVETNALVRAALLRVDGRKITVPSPDRLSRGWTNTK